ncbi:MAG: EVE domain-containing protein [Verrucomicrobiota bacterium]|nr:EVE domain-containing protein [Limisphaera sp.]MDW8380708.1 EVE domain-containing protein [Verrucomicrobiota bacterium]
MQYWLVKQEPAEYPWDQFLQDRGTAWTGVRNFQARNHLRSMRRGDLVLYYHSGEERAVVGIARVTREAYPDPTAQEEMWVAVDLAPIRPLEEAVPLHVIKKDPVLCEMALVRQSRLSVMPVTETQWRRILELGRTSLPIGNNRP